MSQYILISRLKVQNANAIAGFTWGFPAITHFLGFTHNLERKLKNTREFSDIGLLGCAVIAHEHHVHTYGKYDAEFTQNRNPPYLASHDKEATPPIVEEGKMNMTVSLLIGCTGNVGNREDSFIEWLDRACLLQRLAGGTIINDKIGIEIFSDDPVNLRLIKRKLLPGFILMDRSAYLEEHYESLCKVNPDTELLDAWMDFSALKRKARPKSDLLHKHLTALYAKNSDDQNSYELLKIWRKHLEVPYRSKSMPDVLSEYFSNLESTKANGNLIQQWQEYCAPNEKTDADWEYIPKPKPGYLVPIMVGYKAISPVYPQGEVANTRDNETPVCFVEAVHSVGEWKGVHRVKSMEELNNFLWHYHYEGNWYLCKQLPVLDLLSAQSNSDTESEYDWY